MFGATKPTTTPKIPTAHPVAYFCLEFGISDVLPIYAGGLGILAGDVLQEASEQGIPFVGIGLFYKKGYFHQVIDENGQEELPQPIQPPQVPLQLIQKEGDTLLVEVPIQDRIVYAQIWRYQVGLVNLFLLDTDHWRNPESDRRICDQLYISDQSLRLQQELVLGIGGVRALQNLGIIPCLYHMNEGHAAFLAIEIIAHYLKENPDSYNVKFATLQAQRHLIYTNHTLVAAGNELYPLEMIRHYLSHYAFASGIGIDTLLNLGYVPEQPGFFSMTRLALRLASRYNAVSRLHARKAALLWPEHPPLAITNGVHLPGWMAAELQQLIKPFLDQGLNQPVPWKGIKKVPLEKLWSVHQLLKQRLLDEVYAREGIRLDIHAFTLVWARRFAGYKRPNLLFSDIERLKKLLFNQKQPLQILIAGKAHPADIESKKILELIEHLSNYDLRHRVVVLDDYSISLARLLVSGADLWLNTPVVGMEASGTSGMKAASNGIIQCTTKDGWAAEVDWYGLGYTLPAEDAASVLYKLLEEKILPTYYRQGREGFSPIWVEMMRQSISTIAPQFSTRRMLHEYQELLYGPALAELKL